MTVGASDVLSRFQSIQQTSVLPRVEGVTERERLIEVAQEFEALFIKQMLDAMRATRNPENNLVDGGMAENIFEDMLFTEYSRLMSRTTSFGLAEKIVNQLLPMQTPQSVAQAYEQ
jgi:flagellar protein FlgJ